MKFKYFFYLQAIAKLNTIQYFARITSSDFQKHKGEMEPRVENSIKFAL